LGIQVGHTFSGPALCIPGSRQLPDIPSGTFTVEQTNKNDENMYLEGGPTLEDRQDII
jgi:hypothetical protein